MAAPKKTSTTQKKTAAKPAAKETKAAKGDPVQDTIELVRGFQINTLIAIGLAVLLLISVAVPDFRYIWWLNIFLAASSGYMFWKQGDTTSGTEQKVCRWGLLIVALLFLVRDISISNELAEFDKNYGDLNDLFK